MRETRAVRLDGDSLDAFLTLDADAVRIRVPEGECERLGLFAGKRVVMAIEDGGAHPARVTEVRRGRPFALVAVEFPARG
jgi:hypothetical protein